MDTSRTNPPACDSKSSNRLIFGFIWSTMELGMSEDSWMLLTWAGWRCLKVAPGDSIKRGWLKTPKSSSISSLESTTFITLVASSSGARWVGSSTGWMPTGGGPVRKPGAAMLIWCSWGSLAFITYLRAWKLVDIGLYPRMMWATWSCLLVWMKISDWSILVRSGSLTKLRLGAIKCLSARIPKTKMSLEGEFVK